MLITWQNITFFHGKICMLYSNILFWAPTITVKSTVLISFYRHNRRSSIVFITVKFGQPQPAALSRCPSTNVCGADIKGTDWKKRGKYLNITTSVWLFYNWCKTNIQPSHLSVACRLPMPEPLCPESERPVPWLLAAGWSCICFVIIWF